MRRIALPLGRRGFVAAAALVLLAATFPAQLAARWLALDANGLAARELRGTIWSAHVLEAQAAGLPLGDLAAGLHPLGLLAGHAQLGFAGDADMRGTLTISRHMLGLDAAHLRLPLNGRLAPLPVAALSLDDLRVRFRDGLCDSADGLARIELGGEAAGVALPGSLAGPVRCEAGALSASMTSASGRERLTLILDGRGHYRAMLSLVAEDAAVRAKLLATGFAPSGGGYALSFESDL